jgi:pyridoxal 5'-phosphate synthase pdxS subunit
VRAKAIVQATTHYKDAKLLAEVSRDLGEAMPGLDVHSMKPEDLLAVRGW